MLSDAGERDTYQLPGSRSYVWDSGEELLTEVLGQPPLRLPRPAEWCCLRWPCACSARPGLGRAYLR